MNYVKDFLEDKVKYLVEKRPKKGKWDYLEKEVKPIYDNNGKNLFGAIRKVIINKQQTDPIIKSALKNIDIETLTSNINKYFNRHNLLILTETLD